MNRINGWGLMLVFAVLTIALTASAATLSCDQTTCRRSRPPTPRLLVHWRCARKLSSAHSFNFTAPNMTQGNHTVNVYAQLVNTQGSEMACVGPGSLTVVQAKAFQQNQ